MSGFSESETVSAGIASTIEDFRRPQILRFDTTKHAWRETVVAALGVDGSGDDSGALEKLAPAAPGAGSRGGSRGTGTPWIRKWKSRSPELYEQTANVYVGFLRDVVIPHLSSICEKHGTDVLAEGLLFQREPSFRCHTPSLRPTGRPHTDADYGHQEAELNVWIPMTRCSGTNSLYSESAPGAGDYAPFALDYGEAMLFWGNRCRHYTVANDSGTARVSIDFRFVPASRFVHEPPRADGKPRPFLVGGYYHKMDVKGTLDPAVRKPKGHGKLYSQDPDR